KLHVWHNAIQSLDVTGDEHIAPDDVVAVVDFINAFGSQAVPQDGRGGGPYVDVNGDGFVAPNDALDVINAINAGQGGEGESVNGESDLMTLLAIDVAGQAKRRQ